MVAKFIIFGGTVQGVGFRYTAHRIAGLYDLTGYVRNRSDDKVELLLQGNLADIDNCVADLKESFGHYVKNVKIEDRQPDPNCTRFTIRA